MRCVSDHSDTYPIESTYRCRQLLEQILLSFVDLVALGDGVLGDLLVQLLDVRHVRIGYLLQNLHDVRELGTQDLVHLDAERDQGGLYEQRKEHVDIVIASDLVIKRLNNDRIFKNTVTNEIYECIVENNLNSRMTWFK